MPQQLITAFHITQDNYNLVKDPNGGFRIIINYYTDPPAGYEVLLVNDFQQIVLCARPCPLYYPPVSYQTQQ